MKKFLGKCTVALFIVTAFIKEIFKKASSEDPKNILVIATFRLGDLVFATPLLRAIRKQYPNANITVLVNKAFVDVLVGQEYVDTVLPYHGKKKHPSLVRKLRRGHYDLSINICEGFLNGVVYGASIPRRIGFMQKERYKDKIFVNEPVTFSGEFKGIPAFFLKLFRPLGVYDVSETPLIEQQHQELPDCMVTKTPKTTIVIHPGSVEAIKVWPHYHDLVGMLVDKYGASIVLTGTESEKGPEDYTVFGENITDLRGKTSLKDLMALYSYADVVVGNDTGPLNLARAMKIPPVTIFGPVSPIILGDVSEDMYAYTDVDCRPCHSTLFGMDVEGLSRCKNFSCQHRSCMTTITPETILAKVEAIMGLDLLKSLLEV